MSLDKEEKLGFREWTVHYEKEQEADREKINQIAGIVGTLGTQVSKLSANMETLIDNQKVMFNKINRPTQWGVFAAFAGVVFVVVGLVVAEIKDDINQLRTQDQLASARNLELHMWFRESIEGVKVADAENETNTAWIMKLEDRLNKRLHKVIQP